MQITEVHISTRHFEFAHGKKPRGTGSWAFGTHPNQPVDKLFWHNGPYGEAAKAAKEHAKKNGHGEMHVMSESKEDDIRDRSLKVKRELDAAARSKVAKKTLDAAAAAKKAKMMKEDFAPIGDVITLVANDQRSEATSIVNDLLSARVLDALQGHKQDIAKSLFAPGTEALQEETEQLDEKNWIAGAVKNKGGLHRALGVKEGDKIPESKIDAAAHKKGKVGKEARLAKTLKGFHK
jgi:hypothetical protein